MEMLNKAFADADAFKKMMEKVETTGNRGPGTPEATGYENRQQRRARERAERKARKVAHGD